MAPGSRRRSDIVRVVELTIALVGLSSVSANVNLAVLDELAAAAAFGVASFAPIVRD